jgi:hypothetical protein
VRRATFNIFCDNYSTGSIISTPPDDPDTEDDLSPASADSDAARFDGIIADTESVLGSFGSRDGVVRTKGSDRTVVDQAVLSAVTDRRILFTIPDSRHSGAVTLRYDEIASISVGEPVLSLTTTDGVGVEWRGPSPVPSDLGAHLSWVGGIRARIRSLTNDVDLAAGAIRTHADALEWEAGLDTYRRRRRELDDLLNDVYCTEPVPETALAPELTDIERTLETAHTRLFIERGRDRLELGRQLIENGDYEQGRKVLQQVQADHARAGKFRDAVERADAFQFGTQRDLAEDIESLGWKIETVAAEPIRQAHEAKISAESADSPGQAVDHWERAFRRYGHVLTLEWGTDERNFAGDPETVRPELERAAVALIDCHSTLADERWNDGVETQDAGEPKTALKLCLDAQRHLERAHELAAEFAPDRVDAIATRLETMADAVMRMRHAEPTAGRAESVDAAEPTETASERTPHAGQEADRALPSADELVEMDTHHEITLDSEGMTSTATDERLVTPPDREVSTEREKQAENAESTDNEARKH